MDSDRLEGRSCCIEGAYSDGLTHSRLCVAFVFRSFRRFQGACSDRHSISSWLNRRGSSTSQKSGPVSTGMGSGLGLQELRSATAQIVNIEPVNLIITFLVLPKIGTLRLA